MLYFAFAIHDCIPVHCSGGNLLQALSSVKGRFLGALGQTLKMTRFGFTTRYVEFTTITTGFEIWTPAEEQLHHHLANPGGFH